jgi:hypothetical protein
MLKFGDAVVLVQKSRDGEISRVNAIVLHSVVQPDGAEEFSPKEAEVQRALKAANGKPLPGGEYVDLAFPNLGLTPQGQPLTTRSVELIFKLAYTVAPWKEGAWLGWEAGPTQKAISDMTAGISILRGQLKEKDEEIAKLKDKKSK